MGILFPMCEYKFTIMGILFQDKLGKIATKGLRIPLIIFFLACPVKF